MGYNETFGTNDLDPSIDLNVPVGVSKEGVVSG